MKSSKRILAVMAVLLAAAVTLTMLPQLSAPVDGASSSKDLKEQLEALKQQKAENDAKLAELESQIDSNRDDVTGILKEKSSIEQQVQLLYEQTALVNDQITTYNQMIAQKQRELDEGTHPGNGRSRGAVLLVGTVQCQQLFRFSGPAEYDQRDRQCGQPQTE